jgi:hypothetical protein
METEEHRKTIWMMELALDRGQEGTGAFLPGGRVLYLPLIKSPINNSQKPLINYENITY